MEALKARKFVGIDLSEEAVQLSIYDEGTEQMSEEYFPLTESEDGDYLQRGMDYVYKYFEFNELDWLDYTAVYFSLKDISQENREKLKEALTSEFVDTFGIHIISRFRGFVEYVFHQERVVWDRNTMLLEYQDNRLRYIVVEQIYRAKQKAYRAVTQEVDLSEYGITEGSETLDQDFCKMIKQFLLKNPTHIIFLTGHGFEGNWMKRTLNCLCSGRRVFLGQNIYANGASLLGISNTSLIEDGMILMQGPEMVHHTIGIVAADGGRQKYVPITTIGKEWFNTGGSLDVILDKSQKIEFFYLNNKDNETEIASCEISDLPARPPKTTRIRVEVTFTSCTQGLIFLTDMGFGSMFLATGKVTVFPFSLIS